LSETNKSVLDGTEGVYLGPTYLSGGNLEWTQLQLDRRMMVDPLFDVHVHSEVVGTNLNITADITAREALALNDEVIVYVVMVEDNLTIGSETFHSVMRKFLPEDETQGTIGVEFNQTWFANMTETVSTSWDFGSLDPANLEAIVFVQNNNTGEIYQAGSTRPIDHICEPSVSAEEVVRNLKDVRLFPNPASTSVQVVFNNPLDDEYEWQLTTIDGTVVSEGILPKGSDQARLDTHKFASGMYIFSVGDGNRIFTNEKIIIVND
jgi:hypothetical protein